MLTTYKPWLSLIVCIVLIIFSVNKRFHLNIIGTTEEEVNYKTYDEVKENFNLSYSNCNPIKEVNFDLMKSKFEKESSLNKEKDLTEDSFDEIDELKDKVPSFDNNDKNVLKKDRLP